ncbi:biotin-dependent carboxyltransferase family protein [Planomicrobium sp. YIM 101495]|uniref:5-oxoprolinase subunit C family protein n=1 Tax=Planomicrobium sp. YIM 101495 TaxID=2665160 RepID=UPI0012B92626|nr:biotin-dependent carboxyltransferase family protein [Planomicrobium sp. YIM 101495]MTD31086.1 5-oxoprolinase/urea amidolyase family protein [Planomicrobium sp. YIM 101495]
MLIIRKAGLFTTIQDLGRPGLRRFGISSGGAMDTSAFRIANLLVGNPENSAAIEVTMNGPEILFAQSAEIALCGADLSPAINGTDAPMWRPVQIEAGDVLSFGMPKSGCRTYLAIAGGIQVPSVMNSASTLTRAGIGGFCGRALRKGDQLSIGESRSTKTTKAVNWYVSPCFRTDSPEDPIIRLLKGRHHALFGAGSHERLTTEPFVVTNEADRMGYRLDGPPLTLEKPQELLSEAVIPGTIQVPASGNPIVLMADCQTTGGYPKIGQIAAVDLPVAAQLRPGQQVRFELISTEQAQEEWFVQERLLRHLKAGILTKRRNA